MRNYMEEYQRWLDSPALSNAEWEELNAIRDDKKRSRAAFSPRSSSARPACAARWRSAAAA